METSNGKLLVYASSFIHKEKQLHSVSVAAEKIAKLLKLPLEVVSFREEFDLIYVYYKNGDEDPIPVYCDKSEEIRTKDVYKTIRNMMFVLSFHPKHSALKQIRKDTTLFS